MPYEARQPSIMEMVPIHIKFKTLEDERKIILNAFSSLGGKAFFNYIRNLREAFNVIELNQVVKRYHTKNKDVLAVDHVDLNIESGSIFGVIGFLVLVKVR